MSVDTEPHQSAEAEMQAYLAKTLESVLTTSPMTREQLAESCLKQIQSFLGSLPDRGFIDETPISAGWLRECGIAVPDSIPDCATVPRSAMRMEMVGSSVDGDMTTARMQATFSEAFKWVEATVVINDGHDGNEI